MKKFIALVLPIAVAAILAAPAAADEISCPASQVRTEITTSLPDPWWQTPQVGDLQNTRVDEVGGETTLICEYWAYGHTVSVMRHPPENTNCTAQEGGFSCESQYSGGVSIPLPGNLGNLVLGNGGNSGSGSGSSGSGSSGSGSMGSGSSGGSGGMPGMPGDEQPSVTYRTGPLSIPQTWQADFDTGQVGEGTPDIWFRAVTATERYIEPQNGAQIGIYSGGTGITKQDCVATPKSGNRIPIGSVPVGTYVCYTTSDGRTGVFRVNQPVGSSPGTLEIGFTTWQ